MITEIKIWLYYGQIFLFSEKENMSDADYKLKVGLEVENTIDENKVKKELEKTWEQAGTGLAQGLEKKKDSWLDKIKSFWQAGKKELDKDLIADIKLNKAYLQQQLDIAKRELQQFKKEWDKELELQARINITELQAQIRDADKWLRELWSTTQSTWNLFTAMIAKMWAIFGILQIIQFITKTFNEFQESQKILVQATGASGKSLKELSDVVLHLQSIVNQSQTEIASAVWEVNTRLWSTGEELEKATENYLKFATVTGQDAKTAIADNIRLFNIRWVAVQEQTIYLDQLAYAGQATWIDVGKLTQNLINNQLALEQMGFSLTESIALLSNFEKNWVNAEQALAAMNEGITSLVKAGKTPTEAITILIESIKNAKTEVEGMQISLETFWNRWGLAMYNAIRNSTFSVQDFTKSLNEATGVVNDTHKNMETFGEWISRVWSWIMGGFVQWFNEWFQAARELTWIIGDSLAPALETVAGYWNAFWWEVEAGLTIMGQVINWERDWTLALTEKWVEMERQRNLIQKNTEVNKQYTEVAKKLNSALNTFNGIKIDDSATRDEFEASRRQALSTAEAFRQALNAKIAFTKGVNAGLKEWSEDFIHNVKLIAALEAEGKNLDKAINEIKNTKYTWTWRKASNNNIKKWGSKSDPIKKKKEELLKLRDLEIEAVKNSMDSEFEKMTKLYDIDREYKVKLAALEGKTNDELLKTADQYIKDYYEKKVKASQEEQKLTEDAIKKAKEYEKAIKKAEKAWEDMKNKAADSLRAVNHELEEMNKDYSKDLWARWVEVKKQIKDNERDKPGLEWITQNYDKKILEQWRDIGQKEINNIDIDKVLEQIKLKEELLLLEKNTTKEQQEQAKLLAEQSETQKMINKHKEEVAKKEEYKNILEAVAGGDAIDKKLIEITDTEVKYWDAKKWEYVAITDFKNQEYARDIYNQQVKLQTEYEEAQKNYQDQLQLVKTHSNNVLSQWQSDTRAYKTELDKRRSEVQKYVADVQRMLASIPSKHRAYGWELSAGNVALVGENGPEQIIARASSYVQPRNSITNHSVVNTNQSYNLNMWDAQIGSFATIDDFLDALRSKLTYKF